MNIETLKRADVWSHYWASGAEHSCGGSYQDGYGSVITHFWSEGFTDLPLGARVLDIATGNGPLPKILVRLKQRQDLQCDAVDLADLAPEWHQELPGVDAARVRFHSRCNAEQLPFGDQSFDLVVSQWGMEYSDLQLSLPEVRRVLKQGGCVQLILHHAGGLPVQLAIQELSHLEWILRSSAYLATVDRMLVYLDQARTPAGLAALGNNQDANATRLAFNDLQDVLQARIDDGQCPDVLFEVRQAIGSIFSKASQQGLVHATEALHALHTGLLHSELRLRELRDHALDEASIQRVCDALGGIDKCSIDVLCDQGHLMAWTLKGKP